ncbi:hypothetical protein E2C01_004138 [Portunus trituberculatus]|uniref:Uncharacterized protein n=1 Tax=Portunus trituberculatus TaxID=210409 RepID=A0A5B7CRL6_PORTR|nr:hypothetical protein [Portunus trituberculatus]
MNISKEWGGTGRGGGIIARFLEEAVRRPPPHPSPRGGVPEGVTFDHYFYYRYHRLVNWLNPARVSISPAAGDPVTRDPRRSGQGAVQTKVKDAP